MDLEIITPRVFLPLMEPSRYKAAYGGRGSGKSHFFAELLIERCIMAKTRAACIREVQGTLKDSVKELLVQKIEALGVQHLFEVLEAEIRTPNGGLIIFKGMQSYNASNIKSLEDIDIAWVEEAQTLSAISLRMLRPTIRKPGSELWFSWNPRHETDAVDVFFRGQKPPADCIAVCVNWYDNPWFPDVLKREKDEDYANDEEMAEHVWGGGYERVSAGAYYAKHIAKLERLGRVSSLPYSPALGKVYTSWDLGVADYTAIWFFQVHEVDGVPRVRVVDYYEASGLGAQDIIPSAMPEFTKDVQDRVEAMVELGRDVPFDYQRHFFPHDIGTREWGSGANERIKTVAALGVPISTIQRGVPANPEDRINAVRELLPMCEFDNSPRVMLGLSRLRRYQKKINQQLQLYMGPLHDEASHGADAFGEFAINCGIKMPKPVEEAKPAAPPPGMWQIPPKGDKKPGRLRI